VRLLHLCARAAAPPIAALVTIAALAGVPTAAQQQPPPAMPGTPPPSVPAVTPTPANPPGSTAAVTDPGIVEIPFDLATRTFKQVLPFDQPFHLAGDAPAGVAKIELQYLSSRHAIIATKVPTTCGSAQIVVPGHAWAPDPPSTWTYSPLLDPQQKVRFILTVPALDAQRYYLFKLRIVSTVTPDKAAAIQQAARSLFDNTLDLVPRRRGLSLPEVERLRLALVDNVKNVLGADQAAAPGTLFDPCLDNAPAPMAAAIRNAFLDQLQAIVDSQNGIDNHLRNVSGPNGRRQALRGALEQIGADQPVQVLLDKLEIAAKTDPAVALFVQRDGGADLATARMADALPELLGPTPPPPGSTSAAIAAFDWASLEQTYESTASRLANLGGWLGELAKPTSASLEQLLTADDRQNAAKLLAVDGPVTSAQGAAQQLALEATHLRDRVAQRAAELDALAQQVATKAAEEVTVDATTTGSADTFQRYFITADLGLLYSWDVSKLVPYAGTNIYFRPVNPNVPLSQKSSFGRRFSVTLGYTLQSIADTNERTRKDLFGGGSLVAGAGFRVTESIRLAAGALIFIKKNPNPLITDERVTASPYLSVSFDWKIAKTFAVIGQKFFPSSQ
jgi:hypothetical protein